MPRGNDGRAIFTRDADRSWFLSLLGGYAGEYGWVVLGYCLMDNHVHLLVQVPNLGLSEGMQRLLGGYSAWWNRKHGHFGHLFVNRFNGKRIQRGSHLLEVARYIDLNPVRAQMCSRPDAWRWSSYRAHVGLDHPLPFLANSRFLELFGSTPDKARRAYRQFVGEGRRLGSDTVTEA